MRIFQKKKKKNSFISLGIIGIPTKWTTVALQMYATTKTRYILPETLRLSLIARSEPYYYQTVVFRGITGTCTKVVPIHVALNDLKATGRFIR